MLAIPIYLFQISDRVLTSRSLDTLMMLTAVIVGAVVLQSVFDAIRRFILMRTAVEVAAQLARRFWRSCQRLAAQQRQEYQTLGDLQQLSSSWYRARCCPSSTHRWRRCSSSRCFWSTRISASSSSASTPSC